MSKLHQIRHCTPLGPQPYNHQVWSQSDERLKRYVKDIHTDRQRFLTLVDRLKFDYLWFSDCWSDKTGIGISNTTSPTSRCTGKERNLKKSKFQCHF